MFTRRAKRWVSAAGLMLMLACQTTIAIGACLAELPFSDADSPSHLTKAPRHADIPSGHEDCPAQKPTQTGAQAAFAQLLQLGATAAPPLQLDWNPEKVLAGDPIPAGFRTARARPTPLAILHCCLRN